MSEEIDPAVLRATKDSLGKFVKKPPLTDKLLGKPPFKFLHDIFSVVIKDHGLMDGLFTAAEMKSDSFKDKESKVNYIQKVIDVMEFVSGERLHIKPGKVVAGLETAKTNALLQSIGKALSSKATSGEAVKKVLAGEKPGKKKEKDKEKDKDKKKDKDGASSKKTKGGASLSDATNKSPDKKPKKDKDDKKKSKKDDGEEKPRKSKDKGLDKPKKKKGEGKEDDKAKKGKEEKEGKEGKKKKKKKSIPKFEDIMADVAPSGSEPVVEAQPELQMEAKPAEQPSPVAEEQSDITLDTTVPLSEGGGGAGFSAPRPRTARSARPSSARPAAPRPKQRAAIEQQLEDVAPSGGGAATATVMFDEDDDDDDHFVVEEKKLAPDPGLAAMMQGEENLAEQAEEGQHGLLVSQILETKKSMEEELRGKTQIERDLGADKGKGRDKDAVRKEVVRLRESIQKVTKSANPLGKMMDFLQEDVDSMQRELDRWRGENKAMTQQIRSEMDTTNTSIEPLKAALAEYEQSIQDQLDKISAVRASVLNNEMKIGKMMAGVMNVAASAP